MASRFSLEKLGSIIVRNYFHPHLLIYETNEGEEGKGRGTRVLAKEKNANYS